MVVPQPPQMSQRIDDPAPAGVTTNADAGLARRFGILLEPCESCPSEVRIAPFACDSAEGSQEQNDPRQAVVEIHPQRRKGPVLNLCRAHTNPGGLLCTPDGQHLQSVPHCPRSLYQLLSA